MPSSPVPEWRLSPSRTLVLDRPRLLGILNATPDSFADGGRHDDPIAARDHAARMLADGADAIDLGGESTRPGAASVPVDEQIRRVVPVVRAIRALAGDAGRVPITIDTTRAPVARAALDAGADTVNDVSAGADDPDMLPLVARAGCGVILMHRARPPREDVYSDRYERPVLAGDVVHAVRAYLEAALARAIAHGVAPACVMGDPGLGFGKTVEQNLALLRAGGTCLPPGVPLLSALSRKSFVGRVSLGRDSTPDERLAGTLALSLAHLAAGAKVFRVHDVAPHAAIFRAWREAGAPHAPAGSGAGV
ncbi:MAG: dihydropteroate synthase [Planctomycetota bacterium]|nr:dihydropteroate synthase [Planctomycetota bacterium]